MLDIDNKTVAELVSENYRTADIFKKNGIDFCCGGKVTVKEICQKKKLPFEDIKRDLELVHDIIEFDHDYNSWQLDKLADYIIDNHHKYVIDNVPTITNYAEKVAKVHGTANPEVKQVYYLFRIVSDELLRHMCKEENILFPYIKNLVQVQREGASFNPPHFGTIQNPIQMMEAEHEMAGNYLVKIAEISNNYTPPLHACNTYRVLYAKLKEFTDDLHKHIHLENNILFPKAIAIEAEYLEGT